MLQTVLSIDVGTTGCKVTAFSHDGEVVSSAYSEYMTVIRPGGISELNPDLVWSEVSSCIRKVTLSEINVCALSVSSLGEAAVLLDSNDNVLGNALLYNDFRGAEEMNELLDDELREYIPQITGQPISYLHTLWKLIWIRKNDISRYEKIDKVLFFADFIIYKLTGRCFTDFSLASRSMAFDIGKLAWDERLISLSGIDMARFPVPVLAGTDIGCVTEEMSKELNLSPETKVIVGGHDQPCGILGSVAAETGSIVSASGTIEAITATVEDGNTAKRLIEKGYAIEPSVVPGKYMAMAISLTGGSLLKWYRSVFTSPEENIGQFRNVYAYLDSKLERKAAGCLVVPYLSGTGTPDFDTKSCGQVYNLRLDTDREDIYKACMEGLCFEMEKTLLIMMDAGMDIRSACSIGGGAYSSVWNQMKADIWNIPVHTLMQSEAVSLGLASLSAFAIGWFDSPQSAALTFIKRRDEFYPNAELNERYQEKYNRFVRLSSVCRELEE